MRLRMLRRRVWEVNPMIINADNYVPVKRTDGRLTPFNTGKVQIGLLYQPKPPEMTYSEELIQSVLLGEPSMHRVDYFWPVVLGSCVLFLVLIFLMG